MAHQRHCTHMHNVLSHSWNNVALHYLFVGVDTISSSSILKCTKSCNMCWIEQLTNAASNCECLPYQLLPRGFAVYQAYVNAMRLCTVSFLLVLLCVSFGFCQHMSYGTCCSIYDWFWVSVDPINKCHFTKIKPRNRTIKVIKSIQHILSHHFYFGLVILRHLNTPLRQQHSHNLSVSFIIG